jgi:hypothetical protein
VQAAARKSGMVLGKKLKEKNRGEQVRLTATPPNQVFEAPEGKRGVIGLKCWRMDMLDLIQS